VLAVSHFFAYLARMRFIGRWGLMHSTRPENIQEHSLRVAMIAHALAVVRARLYGGAVSAERVAVLALYHDASEVLTGDLPRPVKYFSPEIETSYRRLETVAREKLLGMLPDVLREDYTALFRPDAASPAEQALVKAADKLCAYVKCLEEVAAGNREFVEAEKTLRATIDAIDLPEVRYFVETFVPSFRLTLDELT
jgi:5'-deoxynucleotidase